MELLPGDIDEYWEVGSKFDCFTMKKTKGLTCLHEMPINWRCDLCPVGQQVFPLRQKTSTE